MAVSLLEVFQNYKYRPLRAGMYTALGLWGVIPALHAWRELGNVPEVLKALKLDVLMGVLYVVRFACHQQKPLAAHCFAGMPAALLQTCVNQFRTSTWIRTCRAGRSSMRSGSQSA